jgi:hypothetical protein
LWHDARVKINSLQDLKKVQKKLAEAHQKAQAEAAARLAAERQREAEAQLFSRAVGAVQRLPQHDLASHPTISPAPVALQRQKDEEAVLRDALDDARRIELGHAHRLAPAPQREQRQTDAGDVKWRQSECCCCATLLLRMFLSHATTPPYVVLFRSAI